MSAEEEEGQKGRKRTMATGVADVVSLYVCTGS